MHATTPPTENMLSLRAAVLELARDRLAPLFEDDAPDALDALPAWLWSLPAYEIASLLNRAPGALADALADKINVETDRRHPTDQYFAYIEQHHPLLSHVQRARIAEFAQAVIDLRATRGEVTAEDMVARGFNAIEIERLKQPALDLIASFQRHEADLKPSSPPPSVRLREAGARAHARRAFADGAIEADPIAASRGGRPAGPFGSIAR